jgi:hypothetical protein
MEDQEATLRQDLEALLELLERNRDLSPEWIEAMEELVAWYRARLFALRHGPGSGAAGGGAPFASFRPEWPYSWGGRH